MATVYGVNYTAANITKPSEKVGAFDLSGKHRSLYETYVLDGELALNDIVVIGKLPPGAKIVNARFVAPSDGTSGQYDLGWASNGTDAADSDGIFAGAELDSGAGAVDAKMLGTAAGWQKKFADVETTLQLLVIEATTASVGDTLKIFVEYVVE